MTSNVKRSKEQVMRESTPKPERDTVPQKARHKFLVGEIVVIYERSFKVTKINKKGLVLKVIRKR